MKEVFTKYFISLYEMFVYDIEVMSQPWMYWSMMIPIICYAAFFIVKWIILTAPMWIPISFAFNGILQVRNIFSGRN